MSFPGDYDLERLKTFANRERFSKDPEARAAARALADLLHGEDVLEVIGHKRTRGQRKKTFDPDAITIDHPAFDLAMRRAVGLITRDVAVLDLQLVLKCSEATATRALRALLPRAEETIKTLEAWLPEGQKMRDLLT